MLDFKGILPPPPWEGPPIPRGWSGGLSHEPSLEPQFNKPVIHIDQTQVNVYSKAFIEALVNAWESKRPGTFSYARITPTLEGAYVDVGAFIQFWPNDLLSSIRVYGFS